MVRFQPPISHCIVFMCGQMDCVWGMLVGKWLSYSGHIAMCSWYKACIRNVTHLLWSTTITTPHWSSFIAEDLHELFHHWRSLWALSLLEISMSFFIAGDRCELFHCWRSIPAISVLITLLILCQWTNIQWGGLVEMGYWRNIVWKVSQPPAAKAQWKVNGLS